MKEDTELPSYFSDIALSTLVWFCSIANLISFTSYQISDAETRSMNGFLCRDAVCCNITECTAAERVWPSTRTFISSREEIAGNVNLWIARVENKADQFNDAYIGERCDYVFVIFWLNRSRFIT